MKKKRLALIGCGVISSQYRSGLFRSETLELIAICDNNPLAVGRSVFDGIPFYTDYHSLYEEQTPDLVLISTPVASHALIASFFLQNHTDVIIEKPMAESLQRIKDLYALAEDNKCLLDCIFHWKAASEVAFLKEHPEIIQDTKQLTVNIYDNYTLPGGSVIKDDRLGLMGAWLDSGINILSYLDELFPLNNLILVDYECEYDTIHKLPVYVQRIYKLDEKRISIMIDWRHDLRDKRSLLTTSTDEYEISHTEQRIKKNGTIFFSDPKTNRLADHYDRLFHNYHIQNCQQKVMKIHSLLFENA